MSTITPTISALPDSQIHERLARRPAILICMGIIALYLLVALATFIPAVFSKKIELVVADGYHAPSLKNFDLLLGTDIQGHPVIWRLLYGTRIALLITIFSSILSLGIGVFLGIVAGYFGGWIDEIITWLFTTVSSIPWILLMIAMVYALKGTTFPWVAIKNHRIYFDWVEADPVVLIVIALGLTDWVTICRLIRAEVIKHRDRDYVHAARAAGVGTGRILFRHIFPNVFHLVIITFSLGAVAYVQAEAELTNAQAEASRIVEDARTQADRLLSEGKKTADPSLRMEIYADIERRTLDLVPFTYTVRREQGEAFHTYVKGYAHPPKGAWTGTALRRTWLERSQ